MPDWVKVYHRLPYPLRVLAASVRGYYLRWWRYGPETERLVEEALERETRSPQQWKVWQEERLAYVLHRARHKVPYYIVSIGALLHNSQRKGKNLARG